MSADNNGLNQYSSDDWFQTSGRCPVEGAAGERNSLLEKGLLTKTAARTVSVTVSGSNTGHRKSDRSSKSASGMTHAEKEGMLSQRQAERAQVYFVRAKPRGGGRYRRGSFPRLPSESKAGCWGAGRDVSGWFDSEAPASSGRGLSAECQGCMKCAVFRCNLRRTIKRQVGDRSLSRFRCAGTGFDRRAREEFAIPAWPNRGVHGSTVPIVRC